MIIIAAVIVAMPIYLCVYGLELLRQGLEGVCCKLDDIDIAMRRMEQK